jgi:hypothetical protein
MITDLIATFKKEHKEAASKSKRCIEEERVRE